MGLLRKPLTAVEDVLRAEGTGKAPGLGTTSQKSGVGTTRSRRHPDVPPHLNGSLPRPRSAHSTSGAPAAHSLGTLPQRLQVLESPRRQERPCRGPMNRSLVSSQSPRNRSWSGSEGPIRHRGRPGVDSGGEPRVDRDGTQAPEVGSSGSTWVKGLLLRSHVLPRPTRSTKHLPRKARPSRHLCLSGRKDLECDRFSPSFGAPVESFTSCRRPL